MMPLVLVGCRILNIARRKRTWLIIMKWSGRLTIISIIMRGVVVAAGGGGMRPQSSFTLELINLITFY